MAFNNITSRTASAALMPEQVSREMLTYTAKESASLTMFRRIPVARAQIRFPVLTALPTAYFVAGDTGLKQTTEMSWSNKFLNIEEIAAIFPVPDSVVADIEADIWGTAQPLLAEAVGRVMDGAVFFGVNAPSSFPTNLVAAAIAAGNVVTEGAADSAAQGGFFNDIDALYAAVEQDGYDVSGFIASTSAKAKLRTSRDATGQKTDSGRIGASIDSIDGYPVQYPMRGMWPVATSGVGAGAANGVRVLAGDWSRFVMAVREDISLTMSNEAVVQDATGAIQYNSFQQDLTFLRIVFRAGWQVSNPINRDQATEANRYPVAVLRVTGT